MKLLHYWSHSAFVLPAALLLGLIFSGCTETDPTPAGPLSTLLFKSGFEPGTQWQPETGRIKDITGTDNTTGYSWEDDLEADGRRFFVNYADASDGDSNPDMLGANIVKDPSDASNMVFYTWQNDAEYGDWWARVQGEIDNLGYSDVYYKVRIKVDKDINVLNENSSWNFWLMLNELKVDDDRISIRWTRHEETDKVVWAVHRRIGNDNQSEKSDAVVKFDTWQTIEMYVKGGNTNSRYWLKVDGELVLDVEAPLNASDDALWNDYDILKVYGSAVDVVTDPAKGNKDCFKVWYDDLEIWVE